MARIYVYTDDGEPICSWVVNIDPDDYGSWVHKEVDDVMPGFDLALQDALEKDKVRARPV